MRHYIEPIRAKLCGLTTTDCTPSRPEYVTPTDYTPSCIWTHDY